jgi:hypothetical protein
MYQLRSHRSFISYIDRTREYYAAQGYSTPYMWAHYESIPFTPLSKPLTECRVGLVTTAGLPKPPGAVATMFVGKELYVEPANPPPQRFFTDDLFWDKKATHTEDVDSFMPINRLSEFVTSRRIGSASPRFYGVPTDYSQSRTLEHYAPQILEWCREDGLDIVLLMAL